MQPCVNLQETCHGLLICTTCLFFFLFFFPQVCFTLTVNKPPIYPWKYGDFFSTACWITNEGKFSLKIEPENIHLISDTTHLSLKAADGLLWCLGFFHTVSFFSSGHYSSLASGETMENNHNPGFESTGLAYINIDGNLACFLCLQCFREFYCSPVSLLRQYLWVGRPVYSMNKEQQWMAVRFC